MSTMTIPRPKTTNIDGLFPTKALIVPALHSAPVGKWIEIAIGTERIEWPVDHDFLTNGVVIQFIGKDKETHWCEYSKGPIQMNEGEILVVTLSWDD